MKRIWIAGASVCLLIPHHAHAFSYACQRNYYVDAKIGNDTYPGTQQQPFQHIDRALNISPAHQPGDCVNVMPGIYTEQVTMRQGGDLNTATGYVALRAPSRGVVIQAPKGVYSVVTIAANYAVVDGIAVDGLSNTATGACFDGAVFIDPSQTHGPHHVVVENSVGHGCGLGGLELGWGDYYLIDGNEFYGNSNTNGYQGSGISIFEARAALPFTRTSDDDRRYHNKITYNLSHENIATYSCGRNPGCHTDGEGLILDDLNNLYTCPASVPAGDPSCKFPVYPFLTLVKGNVFFGNGGRGIDVGRSSNAVVKDNVAFHNNQDVADGGTWRGEIQIDLGAKNVWLERNIAYATPGAGILAYNVALLDQTCCNAVNSGNSWYDNLSFNGVVGDPSVSVDGNKNEDAGVIDPARNLLGVNPNFTSITAPYNLTQTQPTAWLGRPLR